MLSMASTQGSPSAPLCQINGLTGTDGGIIEQLLTSVQATVPRIPQKINGFTGTDGGIVEQLLTSVQATVPRITQKVTFERIAC